MAVKRKSQKKKPELLPACDPRQLSFLDSWGQVEASLLDFEPLRAGPAAVAVDADEAEVIKGAVDFGVLFLGPS